MSRLPLVSPLDRVLFLKAQDYLRGLPADLLAVLALYTEENFYPAGAVVREAGARVDRIQFLGEGRLSIEENGAESAQRREVEAPGAVGLVHYYGEVQHAPSVRAAIDTLCLELEVGDLDQISEDHFSLLVQFARRSAEEAQSGLQSLGAHRPDEEGFADSDLHETPIVLDLVQRLTLVRKMPFLHGTNLTVLGELIRVEEPTRLQEGEAIWRRGDPVESVALVLDGSFRLLDADGEVRAPAGSVLGALEILSRAPRVEGWVAETPSRVLMVSRELFIDLLEDHHEYGLAYLRYTARRTLHAWAALHGLQASARA